MARSGGIDIQVGMLEIDPLFRGPTGKLSSFLCGLVIYPAAVCIQIMLVIHDWDARHRNAPTAIASRWMAGFLFHLMMFSSADDFCIFAAFH